MQESATNQPQFDLFDFLTLKLRESKLDTSATLLEKMTVTRTVEAGRWNDTITAKEISGVGSLEKVEQLRALQNRLHGEARHSQEKAAEEISSFHFLFKQRKGDRLIPFHNIKRLDSQERVTLQHRPGQILVVEVWANWCGPSYAGMQQSQDLLSENTGWNKRVRIVALNLDKDQNASREKVQQKKWVSLEHLTIGLEGRYHEFCQSFGISSIPEVVLVDQAGTIVYAGHPAGIKLQEAIHELISLGRAKSGSCSPHHVSPSRPHVTEHPHLQHESWSKFVALLSNPPDVHMLSNLKVLTTKTRTLKDGRLLIEVDPLMIRFKYNDGDFEHYERLVKSISQGLSREEYKVRCFTENRERQLSNFYHGVKEILHVNGFKAQPIIRQKRTLNVCKDSQWVVTRTISYPNIPHDGQTPYHTVERTIKDLSLYHGQVKEWSAAPIDGLRFVSPLTIAGHRFMNIRGLHDYNSDAQTNIESDHAHLQIVVTAINHDFMERHLNHFLQFAGKHPSEVVLHIIVLGGAHLAFLDKLAAGHVSNIRLYRADRESNNDLKIMGFESYKHTVIVNKQGLVFSCGRYENYEDLESLFKKAEHSIFVSTQLSKEFLKVLDGLPQSDLYKRLQEAVKQWMYSPELVIIANDEYSSDLLHDHEKQTHSALLKVAVREEHKPDVEPLVRLFEMHASVTEEYISTMDVPLGESCQACTKPLALPYYWYFQSKHHRCVDCAELQDKEEPDKLKRYPLLENAVLVIHDRNIDVKRLGLNLQPTTEDQCKEHSFECNGCSKDSAGEARYICMGCRREPNRRDFVDFCFQCAKRLRSGSANAIGEVMKNCSQDGHQPSHPLLRVLFANGYSRF